MTRPVHNSNDQSVKSNNFEEREFQGTWACVELHDLVESGEISATAAWLAMTIQAYAKRKRGCFASNEYLAKKVHKSLRQVQYLLKELENAGILEAYWKGRMRFLRLVFEKPPEGKRETNYRTENRKENKEETRHAKNCTSDMQKTAYRKKEDTKVSSKEENCRSRDREHISDNISAKTTTLFASGYDDPDMPKARKLSSRLYNFLANKGKICRVIKNLKGWDSHFKELLVNHSFEKISSVMEKYERHFGDQWLSSAYSAQSFCDKFAKIQDNITRIEEEKKKDWNRLTEDQIC